VNSIYRAKLYLCLHINDYHEPPTLFCVPNSDSASSFRLGSAVPVAWGSQYRRRIHDFRIWTVDSSAALVETHNAIRALLGLQKVWNCSPRRAMYQRRGTSKCAARPGAASLRSHFDLPSRRNYLGWHRKAYGMNALNTAWAPRGLTVAGAVAVCYSGPASCSLRDMTSTQTAWEHAARTCGSRPQLTASEATRGLSSRRRRSAERKR
jgi:hypothetical protein